MSAQTRRTPRRRIYALNTATLSMAQMLEEGVRLRSHRRKGLTKQQLSVARYLPPFGRYTQILPWLLSIMRTLYCKLKHMSPFGAAGPFGVITLQALSPTL